MVGRLHLWNTTKQYDHCREKLLCCVIFLYPATNEIKQIQMAVGEVKEFKERSQITLCYSRNSSVPTDIPINRKLHPRRVLLAFRGPLRSCKLINLRNQHLDFTELGTPCHRVASSTWESPWVNQPAERPVENKHPKKSPVPWDPMKLRITERTPCSFPDAEFTGIITVFETLNIWTTTKSVELD